MARDGERGRGDWKARLGSRNSGPYAEASGDTGPVDIAAVRRDDALIDAIASDGPVTTDSAEEYQLATLLADWRAEITTAPMPEAPDLDEIVAAVNQEIGARQVRVGAQSGGRLRLLRPIAGTAAAVALVIGGMTAFSYNAEPGDPLWRVKEVVFSEQAQTTVVARADDDLNEASTLVSQDPAQAKSRLERAKDNADQVSDPAKHNELLSEWNRLLVELRKVSPELANQLESSASPSPSPSSPPSPSPSTKPADSAPNQPRPTSGAGSSATSPSKPGGSNSGPTILQQPVEPSGTPPNSTQPTTPSDSRPATTTPPPATTTPPAELPTQEQPTEVTPPTTVSRPTAVEPTSYTGLPTRPSPGIPGTTFVVPTEFGN